MATWGLGTHMGNMEGNLEENFEGKLNGRTGGPLCRGTLGVPLQEANMGGHFVVDFTWGRLYPQFQIF